MSKNQTTSREYGFLKLYGPKWADYLKEHPIPEETHTLELSGEIVTIARTAGRKMLEVLAGMNGDLSANFDNVRAAKSLRTRFNRGDSIPAWAAPFMHLYHGLDPKKLEEVEPYVTIEPRKPKSQ